MKLLTILKKDFLVLIRNQADMLVLFLMPLAFIIPISLALGSGDGYGIQRNNQMIHLPVINYDRGARAQDLMASIGESLYLESYFTAGQVESMDLAADQECVEVVKTSTPAPGPTRSDSALAATQPAGTALPSPAAPTATPAPLVSNPGCSEKVARAMLQRSLRSAMLVIPQGFSQAVDAGEKAKVTLLFDPTGDAIQLQQIEGVIQGATLKVSINNQVNSGLVQLKDLVVYAPQEIRQSLETQQQADPAPEKGQKPAVSLQKIAPENYQFTSTPDTYQQTIPGYTIMYVFFIITSMAGSIRQEKVNGTFRRLLSAPISRAELLGGKLLATLAVGILQVVVLFLVGAMVFGLGLGNDPVAFLLLTVSLVLSAATLGLAVSSTQSSGALAAPLIIAALAGGCMFPLDLMPPFLRSLSYLVPHSWALRGYQNLIVRGLGLQEITPQILALLGFSLAFFLFALWRFRFED